MWFPFRKENGRRSNIRVSMEKETNELHQSFLSKRKKRRNKDTAGFPFSEKKRKMKKSQQGFDFQKERSYIKVFFQKICRGKVGKKKKERSKE